MINLCTSSCSEDESEEGNCEELAIVLSPVKPKLRQDASPESCELRGPTEIIKQVIPDVKDDDLAAKCLPVLSRTLQELNVNQLFTLMIGTIPADRICQRKPTSITYSSVFVVDLSCVRCIDDLRADDNGAWIHGGKPRQKYIVEVDTTTSEVISATPENESGESTSDEEKVFTLVRLYHLHKVTPEFQNRISYVIDCNGQTVQYAVVQYLFDGGEEVPVILPPHGNAKKDTSSYRRMQKSTLLK